MALELKAFGYRMVVLPEYGGTVLRADWKNRDGSWLTILEPLERPQDAMNAGCFLMAPFANRIHGGRFCFEGEDVQFPMNRPRSNMACHGFARDFDWQVLRQSTDAVLIGCKPEAVGYPWHFSITQNMSLSPAGITIVLELQNLGASPLPFGFGLHPWFPRPTGTTLTFRSTGAYRQDDLGLPVYDLEPQPAFDVASPQPLERTGSIDRCFTGWNPKNARIEWPSRRMAVDLSAGGALRHLHVYLPENRSVFCAEPVSHAPDAINRPELGAAAAMTVLSPHETLKGYMTMQAFQI